MALLATQKAIFKMIDNAGKVGTTAVHVTMSSGTDPITGLSALVAALNGASASQVTKGIGQTASSLSIGTEVDDGDYTIRDKVIAEYVGSQNDYHKLAVPMPLEGIFLSDNPEVPDPTGPWSDFKTAIQTNVKDKLGNAVKVIRGYRQRSRHLKTSLRFV